MKSFYNRVVLDNEVKMTSKRRGLITLIFIGIGTNKAGKK